MGRGCSRSRFAGDGGCGTLSISEHCLNLGERRCVAGFQKLAMSTGVTRWWKISVISCFTMLYIWKYHTLLSLQLCPPTTMVFPILEMSLHRHSRRPTPTSPRRFTTCGWWGIRWKPFSSLQSSRGPGEKGAWHGRWFIDGLLNIDGLLMVYSWFILYWWFVDVYIYIYIDGLWLMYFDVSWCLLFIPNVAVTVGFQSLENRNGSLEPRNLLLGCKAGLIFTWKGMVINPFWLVVWNIFYFP